MDNPSIHDFIMSRADNSAPSDDLLQIGFDAEGIYAQILGNPIFTAVMLDAMIQEVGPNLELYISSYAMAWFIIGACLIEEKHARAAADNLPPLTDEPA